MQKHPRQAFGIFEDGHGLSIAHIFRENNQLFIDAVERIEMEKAIYHEEIDKPSQETFQPNWDENKDTELKLDEYEQDLPSQFRSDPYHALLGHHQLQWGVVSLNVNDDNIVRLADSEYRNVGIKKVIKEHITEENFKNGDYQYSFVKVGSQQELWIHQGKNKHLDQIRAFQARSRAKIYYQIADANDIALTDYFAQLVEGIEQRILLVYLGEDYRKVFVFDNGKWVDTLPLQISQAKPEPEIIYSKLSFAIDSSPYHNPEVMVLCGDLINKENLEYIQTQFDPTEVSLLGFPHLVITSDKADHYETINLAHFAMPIALALKALNPESPYHTRSNFLPTSIIEGQKVFKIAWHGFVVLALLFISTTYFTSNLLKVISDYNRSRRENGALEIKLAQKRHEAKEIQEIRSSLDVHQRNLDAIKSILDKKNPWSFLLDKVNRTLQAHPTTWLTNMNQEGEVLTITGTTTNRNNVIHVANILPNAQIKKVTNNKIRNISVWQFEISSDLPVVNWGETIDAEFARLWAERDSLGEAAAQNTIERDEAGNPTLRAFPDNLLLTATAEQLSNNQSVATEYRTFIEATKTSNQWRYRELGQGFLQKNKGNPLAPIVRWRTAYRFYIDKEYDFAWQFLSPMLDSKDQYYGYAVLLAARITFAKGDPRFKEYYRVMRNDYALSPLKTIVQDDLRIVGN